LGLCVGLWVGVGCCTCTIAVVVALSCTPIISQFCAWQQHVAAADACL
jgi:hypothetical protein